MTILNKPKMIIKGFNELELYISIHYNCDSVQLLIWNKEALALEDSGMNGMELGVIFVLSNYCTVKITVCFNRTCLIVALSIDSIGQNT